MEENRKERQIQEEIAELVELFPQLKAEDVPQAVWQEAKKGRQLALAYCLWRLKTAEEELKALKAKRLAAGSVSSAGNGVQGTLAAFWDAYQI